jgi:tetratricopeptide (TPR) repeat protein
MALSTICLTAIYSFWRHGKTQPFIRVVFFGAAWFFVTLSVESSIIPIVDVIFEHRMYLPSFGIFLVMSVLLMMIFERWRQKWVETTVFLAIILTALVLAGITYSRNKVWNDKIVLWQDVVNKSPGKARAYFSLGKAYFDKGFMDESITEYRNAIKINPSNADVYDNLGSAYFAKGLIGESIEAYRTAININSSSVLSHYNLGCAYFALGLIDASIIEYRKAINIDPSHASAHHNLGCAYMKLGLIKEAEIEMRRATMLEKQK